MVSSTLTPTATPARRRIVALLACSVLVLGVDVVSSAQAPTPATSGERRITTNFRDTDIQQVAEAVAMETGRTFIVDPRVRANVNLISSSPMNAAEFYQAFLSILQVYGFAAVQAGNVIKIIPDANVRTMPSNDLPDRGNGGADEMVTQVITARNTNAAQLVQVLRPLIAQYGLIQSMPGSNTMIISDRKSNVDRIMRIISRIDQAGDANIEVIPLQNSSATEVVRTITALNGTQPAAEAGGIAPRIVADDRSNSVLVSGESAQRLRIATLIAHLDTPIENGGGTEVIYLRYADAEKIAPKLNQQLSGVAAATGGGGGAAGAAGSAANTTGPNATGANIWADSETNALVITAQPKVMRSLKTIIDRLDIRRAQVLVEAIIVDVNTNKSADLGVNWAVFSNEDGTNVPAAGFIAPVAGTSIVNLAQSIASPATATAPTGATIGIGRLRDNGISFGAMIRALRADDNTNVIATPSTTTMDNQEAELKVAQEVPFITGQYTNTGSTNNGQVNPFTTVQRQEVGTILKITPQINGINSDAMMLKIELESSELTGQVGDSGSRITDKRSIKTTVLIEDGGVVVIGGLIRDSKSGGETRVPFLGRIPLIGEAFKVRNGKREKKNLMVFIRPKILSDGMQTAIETNAKYNFIREEQRKQGLQKELIPLLPFDKPPSLPDAPPLPPPRKDEPAPPPAEGTGPKP
ncbi:MAG TPA: type II secretion system secretin GspD [Steroidobacteraceae bacterium]|nr:type II secretion system secretin GspD [Steroidobacteraceae bacterium]